MVSRSLIVPIILAAGDSKRMGYPKALLPLANDTFLTRILRTLQSAGLAKPVILLGRAAAMIQPKIADWPAHVVVNPDPDRGQLSSIQLGLSNLDSKSAAALIWPVDLPGVSEALICRLVELFISMEPEIALPTCGERRGHPAIFHRCLFPEIMDAPLERGPKEILLRHQAATSTLPTEELACFQDIDTPEDYLMLTGIRLDSVLANGNTSAFRKT